MLELPANTIPPTAGGSLASRARISLISFSHGFSAGFSAAAAAGLSVISRTSMTATPGLVRGTIAKRCAPAIRVTVPSSTGTKF